MADAAALPNAPTLPRVGINGKAVVIAAGTEQLPAAAAVPQHRRR